MNIAIIGAGFTGLAAAHQLNRAGHQVTIYEASRQAGGLAKGFKQPQWDWYIEDFYHHWFASDSHVKQLFTDLNLEHHLIYKKPTTVVYFQKKFHPLDTPLAVLKFPGFTPLSLLRFGVVTLFIKYICHWKNLEKYTAHTWLKKWYGPHLYHIIWQPLLEGKFGPYYQQVNMAWMWARIKARTSSLGTYQGGFQQAANDIVAALIHRGVDFKFNHPISHIETKNHLITLTDDQQTHTFDKCLFTGSPQLFTKLTPSLPTEYLSSLHQLKHLGAVVVIFSLKHQLSKQGYYWYNLPKKSGFPFLILAEHTNFVSSIHFNHEHLIYCGDYLPPDHPYFSTTDDQIIHDFTQSLHTFNPQFNPGWINQSWVYKVKYAQPVPFTHHSQNIPSIKTPIENLFLANMSQVYPWDRGTNFAVEIGNQAASLMK